MEILDNPQLKLAEDFVEFTDKNVFLTGKAGTGKTTFLHNLKKKSPKRMIVVAPTGVAAINAGGVTIHSFFQLPFGPFIPAAGNDQLLVGRDVQASRRAVHRFNRNKINIIKSLDLVVIDEISMVRADLLDGIDEVLRRFRDRDRPFGGVQLLMIGDLQQLAPVVKDDEWSILQEYYDTMFFFSSKALRQAPPVTIELKHIYRQSDPVFIDLLNKVRENAIDEEALRGLNKRFLPEFAQGHQDGYITLTTHNYQAVKINQSQLHALQGKLHTFSATIHGDFPEYSYPTEQELMLKTGAQVMFVKNDTAKEKRYYNGKIGTVVAIHDDSVHVKCTGDEMAISVECVEWHNTRYAIDDTTKEIKESVAGTFAQFPLKLAWAITIHKSQGLTFEHAIIDANAAFAHGQVYVALSRCKTLEGMVLSSPITPRGVKNDSNVSRYCTSVEQNQPDQELFITAKEEYQHALVLELFDFTIMQRQLYYCVKCVQEHRSSLHTGLFDVLETLGGVIRKELVEVGEKFNVQLKHYFAQQPSVEENMALQGRIAKASTYFVPILERIVQSLQDITIETDNKNVRTIMKNALTRLYDTTTTKMVCMRASQSQFTVKNFLQARAVATLEMPDKKKKRDLSSADQIPETILHPRLFAQLKAWRTNKAEEYEMPVYMVIQQKTIYELLAHLPMNLEELLKIKGFGKRKVARYGSEIIEILSTYCRENNVVVPVVEGEKNSPPKKEKVPTKTVSLELFNSGKTIPEIAMHRGMAVSTIEGHLAHFVAQGEIPIDSLVSPEKMALITNQFQITGARLTPVKEALGEKVSYGELRFVLNHLIAEGAIPVE